MKSGMPAYNDEVGSSLQKIRGVLQQRGTLDGFSSSVRDEATRQLSEEIVGFILARLEEYLAENASETVDQVSGRIQAKLDGLGESGVSVSDDAVDKIKDALSGLKSGSSVAQDVAGILNSIGSKISALKDFIGGSDEEKDKKKDKKKANDIVQALMKDKDVFIKFIDEVMPQVAYLEKRVVALENYMQVKADYFSNIVGKKTVAAIMALAVANAVQAASSAALASSNFSLTLANIQLFVANFALSASGLALAAAKLLLTASNILLAAARVTLMVSVATFMVGVLTSVIAGTAAFIAAVMAASATAMAGLLAAVVVVVTALAAASAAVLAATAVVMAAVFAASAGVMAAFLSSALVVASAAMSLALALFGSALSVSLSMVALALSMTVSAAFVAVSIVAAVLAAAVAAALLAIAVVAVVALAAMAVATVAIVAAVLAAAVVIAAGALVGIAILAGAALIAGVLLAAAAVVVAVAVVVALTALVVVAIAGAIVIAAAVFAGALLLAAAIAAAALTVGVAAVAAAIVLLAAAGFALALSIAIALMTAAVAVALALVTAAVVATSAAILLLTILILAVPILLVLGIQWVLDKIKGNINRLDPMFDTIDGWMDTLRSDEDSSSGGFGQWIGDKLASIGDFVRNWVSGWGVWKWLGAAWSWLSNWSARVGYAIRSYIVEAKNKFIMWWNSLMDSLVNAGKFSIFGHEFDLFSGATGMKIGLDKPPTPPAFPDAPPDDQAELTDVSPDEIADGIREQQNGVQDAVKQYGDQRRAAAEKEDAAKAGAMDASGAEVDAELDALLEEAAAGPDVSTPPVPVKTPGAGTSLEEQEG